MSKSKDKKLNKQNIIIAVLVLLSIIAGFLALSYWDKSNSEYEGEPNQEVDLLFTYNGQEYLPKKNVETFLVMGLDKYSDEVNTDLFNNNLQSDFLMLFVLDHDKKTCNAIHINRDTMTQINVLGVAGDIVDVVNKQIALSHTYGNGDKMSCRNTSDAVSKLLLDIDIDHYASVTMDAVPIFNDYAGGVELEILDDFTGIDDTLIKGQKVLLQGEHALHYVRFRKGVGDNTNASRMIRQRQYIEALYNKAKKKSTSDNEFTAKSLVKISDYLVSDCSISILQETIENIENYTFGEIYYFEGETKQGEEFIEFYPTEDSITQIVANLFYDVKK